MRKLGLKLALPVVVFLAVFFAAGTASAQGYLSLVVNGLKHSPVYVSPDVEKAADTASTLKGIVAGGDNIVLVMLPQAAITDIGGTPDAFAAQVSQRIGSKYIIGLAVGDQVVGYAPSLPTGTAADLMNRAESVSNDPVTALETYTRNVHQWQSDNPQPAAKGNPLSGHEAPGILWLVLTVLGCLIALGIYLYVSAKDNRQRDPDEMTLRSPDQIRHRLQQILDLRRQVASSSLRDDLWQICRYAETYYSDLRERGERPELHVAELTEPLQQVILVLQGYIRLQNRTIQPVGSDAVLADARQNVASFREELLRQVELGSQADLFELQSRTTGLQQLRALL